VPDYLSTKAKIRRIADTEPCVQSLQITEGQVEIDIALTTPGLDFAGRGFGKADIKEVFIGTDFRHCLLIDV
jgi:hypothetical protein